MEAERDHKVLLKVGKDQRAHKGAEKVLEAQLEAERDLIVQLIPQQEVRNPGQGQAHQ